MSDEFQRPAESASSREPLLWITGCVVGAAHPPSPPSADALLWYALEQIADAGSGKAADASRHR